MFISVSGVLNNIIINSYHTSLHLLSRNNFFHLRTRFFFNFWQNKNILKFHSDCLTDFNSRPQYKLWLKPVAEQQFLYGHHVMKSGLGRITEGTTQYQGVIVYSMNDLPLVRSYHLVNRYPFIVFYIIHFSLNC